MTSIRTGVASSVLAAAAVFSTVALQPAERHRCRRARRATQQHHPRDRRRLLRTAQPKRDEWQRTPDDHYERLHPLKAGPQSHH